MSTIHFEIGREDGQILTACGDKGDWSRPGFNSSGHVKRVTCRQCIRTDQWQNAYKAWEKVNS